MALIRILNNYTSSANRVYMNDLVEMSEQPVSLIPQMIPQIPDTGAFITSGFEPITNDQGVSGFTGGYIVVDGVAYGSDVDFFPIGQYLSVGTQNGVLRYAQNGDQYPSYIEYWLRPTGVNPPAGSGRVSDQTISQALINSLKLYSLPANSVPTSALQPNSVTNAILAPNSTGTENIIDRSLTASKYALNSVGTAVLQDKSLTTSKYGDGSIVDAAVSPLSLTDRVLADNAAPTRVIQNGAVNYTKLGQDLIESVFMHCYIGVIGTNIQDRQIASIASDSINSSIVTGVTVVNTSDTEVRFTVNIAAPVTSSIQATILNAADGARAPLQATIQSVSYISSTRSIQVIITSASGTLLDNVVFNLYLLSGR